MHNCVLERELIWNRSTRKGLFFIFLCLYGNTQVTRDWQTMTWFWANIAGKWYEKTDALDDNELKHLFDILLSLELVWFFLQMFM